MVFTEEERKERKLESNRIYREKNKEKLNQKRKETYFKNHEKELEYRKQWRAKLPKENKIEWNKKYNLSEKGYKTRMKAKWKSRGIKIDNFDYLWEQYTTQTNCELCNIEFKNRADKQLDHDHESGEVRYILCIRCNVHEVDKKIICC